jgi:hypothetical protein
MTMQEPYTQDAIPDAYQPYAGEVQRLLRQHLHRRPPLAVVLGPWRAGLVGVLGYVIVEAGLLPDEQEAYIRGICDSILQDTQRLVHDWDARDPGSVP